MITRSIILLAEPDEALSASLCFALELQGFQVEIITPEQLLEAGLIRLKSSCVVIGEGTRGDDGLQLALRLGRKGSDLAVILLTTNPTRTAIERAFEGGVMLVEKPLLGEALSDALHKAFEPRRAA